MLFHKNITISNNHGIVSFVYIDESERLSDSFNTVDLYKFAYQQNDNSIWVIINTNPIQWKQFKNSGTDTDLWDNKMIFIDTTISEIITNNSTEYFITSLILN